MSMRVILGFVVTVASACVGCGLKFDANNSTGKSSTATGSTADDERKTKLRAAYTVVAKRIADEHRTDPSANPPSLSSSRLIADAKMLVADMRQSRGEDTELQFICDEATAATEATISATQRLEQLPRPPGEFEQFVTGFFYGYSFNFSGAADYANGVQNQQAAIQSEIIRLGQSMDRGHAATLLLPRVARKVSGPTVSSPPLSADFDETWGFSGSDWITLTNVTGRSLHNVTVVVELEGNPSSGRQRHTNVHFIPELNAGAAVYGKYDEGVVAGGRRFGCKTVFNVQKTMISVFADELTYEGYTYSYTAEEMNKDVARYVDKSFSPRASYRPFDKGIIFSDTERAINMDFKGCNLSYVTNVAAKVTFKRGTLTSTKTDYRSHWKFDNDWTIEFRDIWWDPQEADVELTFNKTNGGGVTRTYHWVWNK